ncbi:MAG: GlsB/YeaQ/YmgE family stress response membrane protein [Nitrospinae bacterium]|nr:GlsB/YeaQ/YmgE family stress response membrane protein [Nitrospinota bacterium]
MPSLESLVLLLVVGVVAGWLAGLVFRTRESLFTNLIVGVIGAFVGKWLFGVLGLHVAGGLTGAIITAFAGAVVLLFVVGVIRR